MARPQSRFVCQSCGGVVPALGRPVPRLRRLEHAWSRRSSASRRARSADGRSGRRVGRRSPTGLAGHRRRGPAAPAASGSASSTASSAAGSCPGRSSCSAASPGIGKSTLLLQAAAGLTRGTGRRCARPVRHGRGVARPGPAARRPPRPAGGSVGATASGSSPSTTSAGSWRSPAPSDPGWSSSTRSRRRRSTSSTGRPGASARSANRRCA